ncbi:DUF983 domain-containing protein [Sphingomonas paeninsulae]|uniref:DUF983 domain-containing protein n=1 Tax=Sphingomonas paeninsulae TaxID=2319844 RepID=A0A494TN01_SPHPE|nr:DUF983 domain-containing protein [Sphingomonas paeninsulae]
MAPSIGRAALQGLCPRCGARTLFRGLLKVAPKCTGCQLDFTTFNVGDGATVFGTLIVGGIAVIGGVTMQILYDPPLWLQLVIWLPVATIGVIAFLRIANAALLASEYRNAAREGRLQP